MDRKEFVELMDSLFDIVRELFTLKNASYGIEDDVFHNFRSTALRVFGTDDPETMFRVLLAYMDKHLVALANKGIHDREYESRLQDIIVYSLLAIVLGRDRKPL
ncbi:MAG: hypothetical protein WC364_13510 [Eubacteriales bacterium]|jgi:hypothetical protein